MRVSTSSGSSGFRGGTPLTHGGGAPGDERLRQAPPLRPPLTFSRESPSTPYFFFSRPAIAHMSVAPT